MAKRMKVGRKYSKKLFRNTARPKGGRRNAYTPNQRGGRRL